MQHLYQVFLGLAYDVISSFLHNRRHKALHKEIKKMDRQTTKQCNKLMHLENSMVMYHIYNAETLENLINTVHSMHNSTTEIKNLLQENLMQHIHGTLMHQTQKNIQ